MWALETLHEPLWQRLTWTLLHFLWQGAIVAVVAATLLHAWQARRARSRYLICLSALVAMAMCPLVTFVFVEVPESATASRAEPQAEIPAASELGSELVANETRVQPDRPAAPQVLAARSDAAPPLAAQSLPSGSPDVEPPVDLSEPVNWRANLHQGVGAIHPYALIVWIAGVLALAVRLSVSWLHVRWLAWGRLAIPTDLAAKASTLGRRLGLRFPARVCLSEKIREAIVVGLWRPLVLVPASWLTEMPPEVLEAVIAHELAHIKRWDLWVNLLQRLVEMFLFYHPAVWWLSRRVSLEREMCTDELAVAVTNQRVAYATALEQLGRMRLGQSAPQFGASIGNRRTLLLNRVGNILGLSASHKKARWWPVALMTLAVPLAIWVVSMNVMEVVGDTTVPPTSEKLSKADLKRWIEKANSSVQSESDAAAEALVAMGPAVAQEMIPLLKSGRTDRLGIKVLKRLAPEPSVQRILVKAIEEARDNGTPNVIHCALLALGESGNVAHADFIAAFLETHDIAAMSALATLGGDRARDHLIGAFDIVPTELWFMLARTLERLGDSAAVPELKKRLAQVELPPNDRFPNATVGAMTGAIAALSGEKEAFTTTTHCQGQHFRYPFGPPGVPKTFSVNPPRDHFVRLPKVDPQSKAGREAIWKAMEEATEGPGFTIDGNEVVAFHGLKMAPLWPDGRPYPTTLYDWLRQTSHQVLRKLVDQEKQTGRCIIPKSGLLVTRDPAGRLHVLVLKKTSDQYTYNVTVMPQDPNMQLIPVRMDAEDLQFTRVAGCTLYDLESETKNGSLNLSRGHLETMTSKKWQGKNEDALLVVEFANNGVSLAVPGAERFLLSEASDAWEKPERALALLRAAMKEEPKIPGHKIVRRDGAIFHLFPELRTGQKFAFAVRMPEGNPVAGVLEVQTVDRKAETLRIRHRFLPTAAARAAEETSEQATQNDQQTPERREAAEKAKGAIEALRGSGANAAWGKEVEGLQLGLGFDLQDRPYVAGETVGFKLLVRNNSAKATTLIDFEPLMGWMPTIRDTDGKRLFVNGQWDGPVRRRKQVVAPGKTIVVGGVSLRLDESWAGPSNNPPHILLDPGKYFVSQTYRFEEDPEATFSGELTSGELALTVAEDTPWGEAVEGVRTRLRSAIRIWGSSDWAHPVVRLTVDARNDGRYRLHLPRNGETWQVEVDGAWYARVPYPGGELLDFESGRKYENLILNLAGSWRRIPKGKEVEYARRPFGPGYVVLNEGKEYGEALQLTRGRHRLRVAITYPPSRAGQNIAPIRAVSNPVEIQIDGQAVSPREVKIRFLGGAEKKPLAGLQVTASQRVGKDLTVATGDDGIARLQLPLGFHWIRFTSPKALPYLPFKTPDEHRGTDSRLIIVDDTPGEQVFDMILADPCELVFRAVDVDTGRGIPGVRFALENFLGEIWSQPIVNETVQPPAEQRFPRHDPNDRSQVTDKDGYFRRLVGPRHDGWTYWVEVWPDGYGRADRGEVKIDTSRGTKKAEHTFLGRRTWGEPLDGLRCSWVPSSLPVSVGSKPELNFWVKNASENPLFWEARSEITLHFHSEGFESGATLPKFAIKTGSKTRPATAREVREEYGVGRPDRRGDDPMDGYYRFEPDGTLRVIAQLPWTLDKAGKHRVWVSFARRHTSGSKDYPLSKTKIRCPPIVLAAEDWGEPVRGVKMRLHASTSRWAQGQTPELRVDFFNVNNQNLKRLACLNENWAIELDGRLYRALRPDPGGEGKDAAFGPRTTRKSILVPLHTDYALADGSSLEFTPGKHTVRIHFTHNETAKVDGQYAEIRLISNPLEIEIVSSDPKALLEQLNAGTLSDDEIRHVTDKVLAVQGDLKQEWDPAWGNWLEVARLQGRVSDADFERYAKQSNPVWQLDAKEAIARHNGRLGLSFNYRQAGGRVTSRTTNHGLIISHRIVGLRVNDVPIDWRGTAGEWTFTARAGHGGGIFREPREIQGIEKLIPGKHEAVLLIEGEIYEADRPEKILHRWKATLKDEIELDRLLLPRGTAVDG